MDKRRFLAAALGAASVPAWAQDKGAGRRRGPTLLTVTGEGVRSNRGPFDPVRDQMMGKQKLSFPRPTRSISRRSRRCRRARSARPWNTTRSRTCWPVPRSPTCCAPRA